MTAGAKLWRIQARQHRGRIADIVHAVAIDAGCNIRVAVLEQRFTVDAARIGVEDLAVALLTGM